MILKFNRFAFEPTRCEKCGRYIWLERYREEEKYSIFTGMHYEAVCKRCVESEDKE